MRTVLQDLRYSLGQVVGVTAAFPRQTGRGRGDRGMEKSALAVRSLVIETFSSAQAFTRF
jgi:hypothetical protein